MLSNLLVFPALPAWSLFLFPFGVTVRLDPKGAWICSQNGIQIALLGAKVFFATVRIKKKDYAKLQKSNPGSPLSKPS